MTEDHDPYAVLGVTPVATPAEINHAFRIKLRDLHPDTRHPRAGGATGDIQLEQLIAAYHLLRDPESRALHDRNATAPRRQQPPSPSQSRSVCANPAGPLTIPVTHHRSQSPAARYPIWAGPVHPHR
ncbi:MAG: DnaJ protein [Mycobacterium sp.]|nr:DnaJ protein [Mycobacterium sp.]